MSRVRSCVLHSGSMQPLRGTEKKFMESHTQGGAFAYPGLNYSALSGLNTLILKHFRTLQSCMRPVSYLSAFGHLPLAALHARTMILLYMALRRGPALAGQPPPAPELGRAQTRAAKSCGGWGGQGKSLPRSFRLLQLERNLVLAPFRVAAAHNFSATGSLL